MKSIEENNYDILCLIFEQISRKKKEPFRKMLYLPSQIGFEKLENKFSLNSWSNQQEKNWQLKKFLNSPSQNWF